MTGKTLEDRFADAVQDVGSLPINMVATPDGQFALTTDAGSREAVWAIRIQDGKGTGSVAFDGTGPHVARPMACITVSPSDPTTPSTPHRDIAPQSPSSNSTRTDPSPAKAHHRPTLRFTAGLAIDDRGLLYVANNDPANRTVPFENPASVAIFDTKSGKEVGRFKFDNTFAGTSNFPLSVAVLKSGSKCYVSSQRDSCVYVLQTRDPANPKLKSMIASG